MIWETLIDPTISSSLLMTLVHSLWQVGLLALFVFLFDRSARLTVERRYTIHVVAMVIGIMLVPVTFAIVNANDAVRAKGSIQTEAGNIQPILPTAEMLSSQHSDIARSPVAPRISNARDNQERSVSKRWTKPTLWVVLAYAVGVWLMIVRLAIGLWSSHRLVARSRPVMDSAIVKQLERLTDRFAIQVQPLLVSTEEIIVPTVVGLVRPAILLPASAMTGLTSPQLELVLAHELSHLRRHDLWVNLLQRVAEALLFFNPCLWYVSRRISTLREYCCDDAVCHAASDQISNVRSQYAVALLRIAEFSRNLSRSDRLARNGDVEELVTLAASGRAPSELRRRIARLFGEPIREPLHLSRGSLLSLAFVAFASILSSSFWPVDAQTTGGDDDRVIEQTVQGRVEVLAIGTHLDQPQRWWNASGELIKSPSFKWKQQGNIKTGHDRTWRRVVIRVRDLPEDAEVKWEIPGSDVWGGGQVIVDDANSARGYFTRYFIVPRDGPNFRLRVGVSTGKWKTVAQFNPIGDQAIGRTNQSFVSTGAFAEAGGTTVIISHNVFEQNFRVIAVDKSGTTHDSSGRGGASAGKIYQTRSTFPNLPRDEVARFEFQTRQYDWTEVNGLPLNSSSNENAGIGNQKDDALADEIPAGFRQMRVKTVDDAFEPAANTRISVSVWPGNSFPKMTRDYQTDEKGCAVVLVPEPPRLFRVWTQKSGHVPLFAQWWPEHQVDGDQIPDEFTFMLPTGSTVGGTVQNSEGEPIVGATVEVMLVDNANDLGTRLKPSIWLAEVASPGKNPCITDSNGRWNLNNVPAGEDVEILLTMRHPDYVHDINRGGLQQQQAVTMRSLRDKTARIWMHRGTQLSGVIVDDAGRPVENAVVIWGDDPYRQLGSQEVRSNTEGQYRFPPLSPGSTTVTVIAEGWRPQMKTVDIDNDHATVDFVLRRGKPLRIQFVDNKGRELPDVAVSIARWRGKRSLYNHIHPNVLQTQIPTKVDDHGFFEWSWAPEDVVHYDFYANNHRGRPIRASPLFADGTIHTVMFK